MNLQFMLFFCIRRRCAWLENRFRAERNPVIIIFQLELHSPHSSVLIFHFLRFVSIFRSLNFFCCLASTFEQSACIMLLEYNVQCSLCVVRERNRNNSHLLLFIGISRTLYNFACVWWMQTEQIEI